MLSGLTCVPHQREPYIVQPRCTCSRPVSTSPSELEPTTVPAGPRSPSATSLIVYAVRPVPSVPRAPTAAATSASVSATVRWGCIIAKPCS